MALKFVVTDKTIYRTTHWRVETDNDTYYVQCQEGDISNVWFIESDNAGYVDVESELGQELIATCETYEDWSMDSDDRFNMDGGYNG